MSSRASAMVAGSVMPTTNGRSCGCVWIAKYANTGCAPLDVGTDAATPVRATTIRDAVVRHDGFCTRLCIFQLLDSAVRCGLERGRADEATIEDRQRHTTAADRPA